MIEPHSDSYFMKQALVEANEALSKGEVPIGAVIVCENQIIARGHNLTQTLNDVTAHAEMLAITAAANFLGGKYLLNCTLYVTLEPCAMCAGAIVHARMKRVVFGASDLKTGCAGSILNLLQHDKLNHQVELQRGVLSELCSAKISQFFKDRRAEIKAVKLAKKAALAKLKSD